MEKKHFETLNICALFVLILFLITKKPFLLYIGMGLIGISVFIKPLGRLLANAWLRLSLVVGTFNSRVLLTIFFFILFTPLALVRRLFGKNLLGIKKIDTDSYWNTVNKEFDRSNLDNTW